MNTSDLLAWGKRFHYPCIVLDSQARDLLRAGEASWFAFLCDATPERLAKLLERKKHWEHFEKRAS